MILIGSSFTSSFRNAFTACVLSFTRCSQAFAGFRACFCDCIFSLQMVIWEVWIAAQLLCSPPKQTLELQTSVCLSCILKHWDLLATSSLAALLLPFHPKHSKSRRHRRRPSPGDKAESVCALQFKNNRNSSSDLCVSSLTSISARPHDSILYNMLACQQKSTR